MSKPKILYIEGEKRHAKKFMSCLQRQSMCDVIVCSSIENGLQKTSKHKPGVVLIQGELLSSWDALSVRRLERRFECSVVLQLNQSQIQSLKSDSLAAFDYITESPTAREIDLILEAALFKYRMREKLKQERRKHGGRQQEAMRQTNTYYRSFKQHRAVQMLVDAETGEILDANQAAISFYGYSIDDFKAMKAWDLNAGAPTAVKQRLRQALAYRESYFETTHRLASGEERDVGIFIGTIKMNGRELLCPVIHDITDRKLIEQEKERLLADMKERMKELRCIYRITKAVRAQTALENIFRKVLSYIPAGWQYPVNTRCKLRFDGIEYIPRPFDETPWRLSSYIEVEGQIRGAIEVYYVEKYPDASEGPFLSEERDLLETIASSLGEAIELREASERLVKEEQLTKKIMDSLPGLCYVIDADARFLRWNKNYEIVTGYSSEEIARCTVFDLADPDEWESVKLSLQQMLSDSSHTAEANLRTKDGRNIPHLFTASRISMDGKEFLCGIGLNITEQKRAETDLRNLNIFLDSIIENIPHVIFLKDKTHLRYIKCNQAFEEFIGLSRHELIGKTDRELFPESEANAFTTFDKKVLRSGKMLDIAEEAVYVKGKGLRIVHTKKIPIFDAAGEPEYLLGISEDITERKHAQDKIKQYADIVENMQVGLFVYKLENVEDDRTLRLINMNPAAARLTGVAEEEIMGKTIDESFPALRDRGTPRIFAEIIRSGQARSFDDFYYGDGRIAPSIFSLKAFPLANTSLGIVFENVTTRRRAEEQLQKLSHAVEQSAGVVIVLDRQGRIEYVNSQFVHVTGYSSDEVMGKDALFLKSGKGTRRGRNALANAIKRGEEWRGELKGRRKNGEDYWVSITISPVRNKQGKITHFVDIESDITERKRQEELLIQSEEKYRQFFEEDLTGDYIATADGRMQICNSAFVRMFGFESRQKALKINISALFSDKRQFDALLEDLKVKKKLDYYECQLLRKDGGIVQVIQNIKGIFDDQDRLIQFQGYMFDDTRRKNLENQIRQSQKMEAIGTLAGGIAHDFNNILAAIISRAGENLAAIFEAGMRARDLVRQILTFSRQTEHELKPVRIDLIVREAIKFLRASFPATIQIVDRVDKKSGLVMADPTQLHQIVMNLCTNAYQAMAETGGVLTLFLSRATSENGMNQEHIRLCVTDTGSGMDEATLQRIFDPFFTTKRVGEGTGLGLSVVHGIVNSLNGHIAVESEVGKGTTVQVDLPRCQDEAKRLPKQVEITPTGHERVLLVDDEKLFLEMGKRMLKRLGYHVNAVASGEEAIKLFKGEPDNFDIAIVDYIMPKMKGSDVAEQFLKIRPDIPIILITGFSEDLSIDKAREMGVRDCLNKPIVAYQLSQTLRNILNH